MAMTSVEAQSERRKDRSPSAAGHLFIVHGRIEDVTHDAAIIPVGDEFEFNPIWVPMVGRRPNCPARWNERRWGRVVNAPSRVWAVSIGDGFAGYGDILRRIRAVLDRIAERQPGRSIAGGRTRALVAVPVVGIGYGGFGYERGAVLKALVGALGEAVERLPLDVALVTPEPAVYAAAQWARRQHAVPLEPRYEQAAAELGHRARRGDLALLLGAGVSVPAGLPTWHQLISQLAAEVDGLDIDVTRGDLSATDQAELIERIDSQNFPERVARITGAAHRPSLLHTLLAGLDCREVITTNYDELYERAVRGSGRTIDSVMPWASAHGADRWILKLHGDVAHPRQIVLTRRHMVRYDAANRPSASLLQSLLLTRRLLVVGASMTDDNVIRLAHEVQAYRQHHQPGITATFGTVLDAQGDEVRGRLWDDQLEWLAFSEGDVARGSRQVEIFLDRVATHASRESSWVLDSRFEGLLPESEWAMADAARRLLATLPQREGTKWSPLVRQLREMGAG